MQASKVLSPLMAGDDLRHTHGGGMRFVFFLFIPVHSTLLVQDNMRVLGDGLHTERARSLFRLWEEFRVGWYGT